MHVDMSVFASRGLLAGAPRAWRHGPPGNVADEAWLGVRAAHGDMGAAEVLGAHVTAPTDSARRDQALIHLRKAADAGHPSAMYRLAICLLDAGESVADGERWLRRAASTGWSIAVVELGARLITGDGVAAAVHEGKQVLTRAAERGSRLAMLALAALLWQHGQRPARDQTVERLLTSAGARGPDEWAYAGAYLELHALGAATSSQATRMHGMAAALCQCARDRGSKIGAVNLAYLVRRGAHVTAESLDDLLGPSLSPADPVALVNQALRLAAGVQCGRDWQAADALVASVRHPFRAAGWWMTLARIGDAEGDLVLGWLNRHRTFPDPERRTTVERFDAARRSGWTVPGWSEASHGGREHAGRTAGVSSTC